MSGIEFTEAQQALWDAASSSLPWAISREAIDFASLECHKPKCYAHHPSQDELIQLLWGAFGDALRDRALRLEDGKGSE